MSPAVPAPTVVATVLVAIVLACGCAVKDDAIEPLVPTIDAGGAGGSTGAGGTGFTGADAGEGDAPLAGAGGQAGDAGAADMPRPAGAIGDKCSGFLPCPLDTLCAAAVAGGGYCTADCTAAGAACPSGSTCVGAGKTRICLKTCAMPEDCRAEHTCQQGVCLPMCSTDADCVSSNCQRATGRCGPSRIGAPCLRDSDCGASLAFCDKTRPDGYCSIRCGGPMNLACPDDANCSTVGSTGVCLKACTGSAECRAGFLCGTSSGGVSSCVPSCASNDDCGPGLRCNLDTGACVDRAPAPGTLGGACATAKDCAAVGAGAFCAAEGQGFPGGYCSLTCDSSPCPAGGSCLTTGTPPSCRSKCGTAADCRPGYTCQLRNGPEGVCIPKCTTDADCVDPMLICDRNSGRCETRPTGAPTMTNGVINLTPGGPVPVSPGTHSDRFIVTVPGDAVSINFFGEAISDPGVDIFVSRLEHSTDDFATVTRLYDATSLSNPVFVPPALIPGSFSVLHPNAPSAPFIASGDGALVKLAIRVAVSKATTVRVYAIVKQATTRALAQGKMNLNLFFVGVTGLDAASARTDTRFQLVFDTARAIWAKSGITVGDVSYIDITGADAARFSDLDVAELGRLMVRSNNAAAKDDALNVFFVNSISEDSFAGFTILGISAGIPGVPIRGTTGSGMAVTMADFPQGLTDLGETWAHESGHFLGLFHTTEAQGTAFDPLPDTPECARARFDSNNDRIVSASECRMQDAPNVMFWSSSKTIAADNVSANQSFVVLRNPAVR